MDKKETQGLMGIEEARSLDVEIPEPPDERCSWCGRPLDPLGAPFINGFRWVSHRSCGCEGEKSFEAARRAEEKKRSEAAAFGKLVKAGIPRRFLSATSNDPRIQSWMSGYDIDRDTGLYLSGVKGSGKTHAASAIARALIYAGYDVMMVEARQMLAEVKETFDSKGSESAVIRSFIKCDLLIIDELGKESAREWSSNTMFDIVNGRYKDMRPTVFCSQHRLDKLEAHLSRSGEAETAKAICSRIYETCPEVWLGNVDRRTRATLQL